MIIVLFFFNEKKKSQSRFSVNGNTFSLAIS